MEKLSGKPVTPRIFLLNGEVIWQASDSSLSKELHGLDNFTIAKSHGADWVG